MLCFLYIVIVLISVCVCEDKYELKGSTVELTCPLRGGNDNFVRWTYFLNELTTLTYNNVINRVLDYDLPKRLFLFGDHTKGEYNLRIRDIRESDEGLYSCSNVSNQHMINLYVIEAPSSVIIDNETEENRLIGTEGTDLFISCSAVGGRPPPNVTLTIDGVTVAKNTQSIRHTLSSVSILLDLKTVLCKASNKANTQSPKTNSSVIYLNLKPLKPTIAPSEVSTTDTNPLTVSCSSSGSRPAAVLKWSIGQTDVTQSTLSEVIHNLSDDTYTVESTLTYNVDKNDNNQKLTCKAENFVVPGGIQTNKTLDVKFAPDVTVSNVTFTSTDTNRTLATHLYTPSTDGSTGQSMDR